MNNYSYQHYVTDSAFLDNYNAYQAKYEKTIRESDKFLIQLIREIKKTRSQPDQPLKLLDIGCSTGNLLLHIHRLLPNIHLTGGDLAASSIEICRNNPELDGVTFEVMDVLNLPSKQRFDIITANAVLTLLDDDQLELALDSIAAAMEPKGQIIIFDYFHLFPQDLSIAEVSDSHPDGLVLRFRPMAKIESTLTNAGFKNCVFRPFTLPIDLLPSGKPEDLITYTVNAEDGRKLPFRGTLFQPWCHATADRQS